MNVFALLSFTSFVLFLQAGVYVIFKNPTKQLFRVFGLLCFLFTVYAFNYYLFFQAETIEQVYLFDRIASVGWVFFPLVTVWFTILLTKNTNPVVLGLFRYLLAPAALFSFYVAMFRLESVKFFYQSNGMWFYTPVEENLSYMLFVLYLLVSVLLVYFVLIGWFYNAETNRQKMQAKIFLAALSIFFLSSIASNIIFPLLRTDFLPATAPINALILIGGGLAVLMLLPTQTVTPELMHNLTILHIKEFLFFLDKNANIILANQFTLTHLKSNHYDLLRENPEKVFSDYAKIRDSIEKMGRKVSSRQVRMDLISREGIVIPVMVSAIKVRDKFQRTIGYILICLDFRQKLKLQEEVEERVRTEKNLFQVRKELELLVEKRTYELQDANQRLQQEVIERRRAEQQIKADLEEKIALVQEVHHRVKNNIQMIISLINMLSSHHRIEGATSDKLREIAEKVRYISDIHEDFYAYPNLSRIAFSPYLKKTIGELYSNFGRGIDVVFKLNLADEYLDINQAIPLGIIFNELLINAMKYAFSNHADVKSKNILKVEFYKNNGNYVLKVSDNGSGLPEPYKNFKSGKVGLKLVDILVKEHLRGKIECYNSEGTVFTVSVSELQTM